MGLMSVHLLLLSYNKVKTDLAGSIHICLDCIGALNKVYYLPWHHIPSKFYHSGTLKNILVNCSQLTLKRYFFHVKANQDDSVTWEYLS